MTANRMLIAAGTGVFACVIGLGLWIGSELSQLRGAITDVSQQSETQLATLRVALTEVAATSPSTDVALDAEEFKTVNDIIKRVNQLSPTASIEEVAPVIAEMDQWIYSPDEEAQAVERLDKITDTLRQLIEQRVNTLLGQALAAENGQEATQVMSRVNDVLSLYPVPITSEHKSRLDQLTRQILEAARRVEEIRRLRYNAWAIGEIDKGLSAYHNNKGRIFTDDAALVEWCHRFLKEIDPAYLEPVTLDLYNYVIGLTANKIGDQYRVRLAEGFADIKTPRRSPADF